MSTSDATRGAGAVAEAPALNAIYPLRANVAPGQIWLQPPESVSGQRDRRRATGPATVVAQLPPPSPQQAEAAAQRPARVRTAAIRQGESLARMSPAAGANRRAARSGLHAGPRRASRARAAKIPQVAPATLVPVAASPAAPAAPRDDILQRPQIAGASDTGPVRLLEAELRAGGPLADVKTALGFARNAETLVSVTVPSSLFLQAVHRDMRREAEDYIQCNPQMFSRSALLAARGSGGAAQSGGNPVVTIPTTIYYATSLDYTFREAPGRVGVRPYTQTRSLAAARASADLLDALLREHPDLRAKLESAARERVPLDGGPNSPMGRSVTLTTQFSQPVAWAYLGLSYEILIDRTALSEAETSYCAAVATARRDRAPEPTIPPEVLRLRAATLRPTARPAPRTAFDTAPLINASWRGGYGSVVTFANLPG